MTDNNQQVNEQASAAGAKTEQAPIPPGFALVPEAANADEIVSRLYRRFKEWSARGFTSEDVTWCEVKADVLGLIAMSASAAGVGSEQPLPPLPRNYGRFNVNGPDEHRIRGWTSEQMQEYGRACYALARAPLPEQDDDACDAAMAEIFAAIDEAQRMNRYNESSFEIGKRVARLKCLADDYCAAMSASRPDDKGGA